MVTTVGGPTVLVSLGALTPKKLPTREKILPTTLPATLPAVETLGEAAGAAGAVAAGASASGLVAVSTDGRAVVGVDNPVGAGGGAGGGAVPAAVETDNGELAGGAPPGFPNGSSLAVNGN